MDSEQGNGPLVGLKVVEIAGIGPSPHACMILADLGADVIRVERPGGTPFSHGSKDVLTRGRPSVVLDIRQPDGIRAVLDLVRKADILTEGMRPGTMERLGLGPDVCLAENPRLIYGRMTGWGQDGPLARSAGHDLTYVAVTGALATFGQDASRPHFPGNIAGDFGGGSTYFVIGLLAALVERRRSDRGQVVDAAIVDGTAHLNALTSTFLASDDYVEQRASNLLDGGRPYYDIYETADGKHLAVAPLETPFYAEFIKLLGLERTPDRDALNNTDELRAMIAAQLATRTRDEWDAIFGGTDACVAPVLSMSEAPSYPHLAERAVFVDRAGVVQPAPAPRFSRTPAKLGRSPAPKAGAHTRAALTAWGVGNVDALLQSGVAVQA